jgi:hypothetical protein
VRRRDAAEGGADADVVDEAGNVPRPPRGLSDDRVPGGVEADALEPIRIAMGEA